MDNRFDYLKEKYPAIISKEQLVANEEGANPEDKYKDSFAYFPDFQKMAVFFTEKGRLGMKTIGFTEENINISTIYFGVYPNEGRPKINYFPVDSNRIILYYGNEIVIIDMDGKTGALMFSVNGADLLSFMQ